MLAKKGNLKSGNIRIDVSLKNRAVVEKYTVLTTLWVSCIMLKARKLFICVGVGGVEVSNSQLEGLL